MFEDATFNSSSTLPNQTPKWMLLALAFNLSVLSALVALPLIYPRDYRQGCCSARFMLLRLRSRRDLSHAQTSLLRHKHRRSAILSPRPR